MKRSNMSLSKLQSPVTTQWLHNNYEMEDGVSLPRSSLYTHYLDFCSKASIVPVNAASFGKIIRNTFPDLKTRRLGTRGQSKYHYYGINVKKSSPYFEDAAATQRQSTTGFSQTYIKSEGQPPPKKRSKCNHSSATKSSSTAITNSLVGGVRKTVNKTNNNYHNKNFSNNSNNNDFNNNDNKLNNNNNNNYSNVATSSTLLPEFPSDDAVETEDKVLQDKIKTFLIMYKAHCQRILDTVLRANFTEVQKFLIHFWQGIPSHILMILTHNGVVDLVGQCDNILYKAIMGVLIPGNLQPLPVSLTQAIQQFAKQLSAWLEIALFHLPENLQQRKLSVAKSFGQQLCRQTSLSHLAQAARTVLSNGELVTQMVADFQDIPVHCILSQVLWMCPIQNYTKDEAVFNEVISDMFELLERQAPLEEFTDWLSTLVIKCVVKRSEKEDVSFQSLAQDFLLKWSFMSSKIIQELTLRSSKSFGSFHLLQMLFDDFIFYKIESQADISEELEYETPEKSPTFTKWTANSMTSPDRLTSSLRSRTTSSSSSGRGSVTMTPYKDEYPTMFNYYENNNTYTPTVSLPSQETNIPVKGEQQNQFPNYPQSPAIPYAITTEEIPPIQPEQTVTEESYYSAHLDIARQLQEKTKTLMESSRYNVVPDQCQYVTSSYPVYDNTNFRPHFETPVVGNVGQYAESYASYPV